MGYNLKTSSAVGRLTPTSLFFVCPHFAVLPALCLCLLILTQPCQATNRWSSGFADAREAALVLGGVALETGSDPAQWTALESLRLQGMQIVGSGDSLGNAVSLGGPMNRGFSFGVEVSQIRQPSLWANGRRTQASRDARIRMGLAYSTAAQEKRFGLGFGAAFNYYDHSEGPTRNQGATVDIGARSPVAAGLSAGFALRDMKIPNGFSDEVPSEAALGLGWVTGLFGFSLDLVLPLNPSLRLPELSRLYDLSSPPVVARVGASYAPTPWSQLLLGCASSEVAGQGGLLGFGGSLRQDQLELSLSAMHRPQPDRSSLHAALAWHFNTGKGQHAEAPKNDGAFEPEPEPTPERELGAFEVQAAFRDGLLHVAWPAGPAAEGGYDLLMGLVPGASMKKVNQEPLMQQRWSGSPGMLGMTYYFRVRALNKHAAELSRSSLCSIQVPAKETP